MNEDPLDSEEELIKIAEKQIKERILEEYGINIEFSERDKFENGGEKIDGIAYESNKTGRRV